MITSNGSRHSYHVKLILGKALSVVDPHTRMIWPQHGGAGDRGLAIGLVSLSRRIAKGHDTSRLQFSRPRRAQVCFENAPNLRLLVFQHSFNVFSMPESPALLSSLQYQAFISEELKFAYVAGWLRTVTWCHPYVLQENRYHSSGLPFHAFMFARHNELWVPLVMNPPTSAQL